MPSHPLVIVCTWLAVVATIAGVGIFTLGAVRLGRVITAGKPESGRWEKPWTRIFSAIARTLSTSTFRGRKLVAAAHWLVMVAFVLLFVTLIAAYGQIHNPLFTLPLFGAARWWTWFVEIVATLSFVGILFMTVVRIVSRVRAADHPRSSRFFGSTRWQAWFVEAVVFLVSIAILVGHGLQFALERKEMPAAVSALDYPLTAWWGQWLTGASTTALANAITLTATAKILISMTWLFVVGLTVGMGISWHRFLAPLNLATTRSPQGKKPLGDLPLPLIDGKPTPDLEARIEQIEDEGADFPLIGIGSADDLTWKGRLDLLTCTECGRCQDVCPAWMTGKVLSPKLMTMAMRDNMLAADGALGKGAASATSRDTGQALFEAGIVGPEGVPMTNAPLVSDVLGPDLIWDCTMCGACMVECPVDIAHVDLVSGMRRHQVLMESDFPRELAKPFRSMETRMNPYNQSPRRRMDWAKDLPFDIPVLFEDAEDATEFDYLFWVGCAGSFDEGAKQTSRAVAELLHTAGVSFAVLGSAEGCTGDPARRAGNEILFQMLAENTIETFKEAKVTRVVATCAHCFNTFLNEYPQLGAQFEVVHHTQLLNRLVREGKLTPVAPPEDEMRKLTYHDPCFLGRYNDVYEAPRDLLGHIPDVELVEMSQHGENALCCGAGGARAWMEETTGERIASVRLEQAEQTGAETVATACPFCTQMLDSAASAGKPKEIKDVAVLLLEGVRRGQTGTRPRQ